MKFIQIGFILFLLINTITNASYETKPQVLTIEAAVAEALQTDLDLREASLKVEAAGEELKLSSQSFRVETSLTCPNSQDTKHGMDITLNSKLQLSLNHNQTESDSLDNTQTSYILSYSPFKLKQDIEIKQKEVELVEKIRDYELAKEKLIMDVRTAYAKAWQKKELFALAKKNLELINKHFQQTEARFFAGKAPRIDVIEAETEVKISKIKLHLNELDYQAALFKLSTYLGENYDKNLDIAPIATKYLTKQIDLESTKNKLNKISPEIKAAIRSIELEKLNIKAAKSLLIKDWKLELAQTQNSLTNDDYYTASISGPLYDATKKGNYNLAKQNLEIAKTKETSLLKSIPRQLEEAYDCWLSTELIVQQLISYMDVNQQKLEIAILRYDNGSASGSDVVRAYQDVIEKEEEYWQAWLDLQQNAEEFYKLSLGQPVLK